MTINRMHTHCWPSAHYQSSPEFVSYRGKWVITDTHTLPPPPPTPS